MISMRMPWWKFSPNPTTPWSSSMAVCSEMQDVSLTFSEDALRSIARKAIERKTGARGLRSILENVLLDTMFELPGLEGVEEIAVNSEVIEGRSQPLYMYVDRLKESGETA